jgi:hypothetical protein
MRLLRIKFDSVLQPNTKKSFRNRDKMKDDAIAQPSDQLLAISTRLQELERKQAM